MTRARNNKKAGVLKKWALGVNLFFIVLLLLTYVTPYVNASSWGWLSLLALTYPFVLLINALFALGWMFSGRWHSIFSLAALVIGFGHHMRYVKLFSLPDDAATCKESIQMMTYNMRGLSLVPVPQGAGVQAKIDQLYDALADLNEFPDIICLQEGSKGEQVAQRFGLGYTSHAPKSSLWVLSKFPIIAQGELPGQENSTSCMWADIKTPSGMLRVYNMHLVSNRVTNTTASLIQEMDLQNENTWQDIRFIVGRYKRTTQKRAKEAKALREHMSTCTHPVVIAGDGNDTPLSNTYHVLAEGLRDSFKERGYGISTTYESTLPMLRIDYFFGTADIRFKEHRTHHLTYSDHYPVCTGICLRSGKGS